MLFVTMLRSPCTPTPLPALYWMRLSFSVMSLPPRMMPLSRLPSLQPLATSVNCERYLASIFEITLWLPTRIVLANVLRPSMLMYDLPLASKL